MKIYIDPGHGSASGSVVKLSNDATLVEESLNWDIAQHLDAMLSQAGHLVMLSRGEKECPVHKARARKAITWGADIALSIHHNINPDPDPVVREQHAKTEIYVVGPNFWVPHEGHPQLNTPLNRVRVYTTDPVTPKNEWMQKRIVNILYPYRNQGFSDIALLECGYLNVESHQKIINQPGYTKRMAQEIAAWIEARERKVVVA